MTNTDTPSLESDLYAPEARTSDVAGVWNLPIPFDVGPLLEVEKDRKEFEARTGRKLGLLARIAAQAKAESHSKTQD